MCAGDKSREVILRDVMSAAALKLMHMSVKASFRCGHCVPGLTQLMEHERLVELAAGVKS